MNVGLDRRKVLQLLIALSTSVATQGASAFSADDDCRPGIIDDADLTAIRELGREYLARRPRSPIRAMTELLGSPPDEALRELRARVSADFAAGRMLNLSGWFVSETEGCVFAALQAAPSHGECS